MKLSYGITALIMLLLGGGFYAFHYDYVMVIFPHHVKTTSTPDNNLSGERSVTLFMPDATNATLTQEQAILKISNNVRHNHEQVITTWLNAQTFAKENTKLASVALSPDQRSIFITFGTTTPFNHQSATYDKLLWIQGLLTTLHAYNDTLEYVYFLGSNKPLHDHELDFSRPWPIEGFLS